MPALSPWPALRLASRGLAALVYPSLCYGCEARVDPEGLPVCPVCAQAFPHPVPGALAEALGRLATPSPFTHALSLWTFDAGGAVQRLQHAVKYGGQQALGVRLGGLMSRAWVQAGLRSVDALVPVPLARLRLLERGFNQAEALAQGLAANLPGAPPVFPHALARTRETVSQTRLRRADRQANLEGAFGVAPGVRLDGAHVVLVDDVLTTGATAVAAGRALANAGAEVSLVTLASVA